MKHQTPERLGAISLDLMRRWKDIRTSTAALQSLWEQTGDETTRNLLDTGYELLNSFELVMDTIGAAVQLMYEDGWRPPEYSE